MDFSELLVESTEETSQLFKTLRALILNHLPSAIEEIDIKGKLTGYLISSGYTGTVFTLILARQWVTLGFNHGASLPDPEGLLEGNGKVHRFIRFQNPELISSPALNKLLDDAIEAARCRCEQKGISHA